MAPLVVKSDGRELGEIASEKGGNRTEEGIFTALEVARL